MQTIYEILNQLSNEPSTNNKIEILKQHQNNQLLKDICYKALNKLINFYIIKIPEYEPNISNNLTLEESLVKLDKLSDRTYTGNNAINYLKEILEGLSNDDADVIKRVVKRDLRCGVNTSTVNKIWKNLIPTFPYMRISLPSQIKIDKINWGAGVFSQLKEDSLFANINLDDDSNVQIYSRNGTDFSIDGFTNIVDTIKKHFKKGFQYNGEMLVKRDGVLLPREVGNGILNHVAQGGLFGENEYPVYHVWDMVHLGLLAPKCVYVVPYSERFKTLKECSDNIRQDTIDTLQNVADQNKQQDTIDIPDNLKQKVNTLVEQLVSACINDSIELVETRMVYSMEEAMVHYKEILSRGLEGTILKLPEAIWKDGTSKEMIKLKLDVDVDLNVIGFLDGNGKNEKTFGSIACQTNDGLLEVNVSGLTDEKRLWIHENRDSLIGKVVTVKSNNLMPPTETNDKYSLFLPRFVEFRNDKDVADTLEMVIGQFENAIK
jgi:DNA ligase-1